ncbi:MAG: DinB family protein [Capsulimonas sp.]|uniref:DinB family protein n=1 Tax=Capsulimonas sp. TaxID=2494211 RepID=UPI003267F272
MTILDRLLGHDAWTTRQLLFRCRELTDAQLDQIFDIGDRSLRDTFVHMIECAEIHMDRMMGRPDRVLAETYGIDGWLRRHSLVSKELAELATRVEREGRADEMWVGGSGGKRSLGGGITHLITHSMHHRAQALYLMEKLGLKNVIEGDALGWESVARGWGWEDGGSSGLTVAD